MTIQSDFRASMRDPIYGQGTTTAYTGTAGTRAALPRGCGAVYVWCTTAAHIKVGVGVTAVVDVDMAIPAAIPVVLPVNEEASVVSAVKVTGGTDGTMYCIALRH